MAKDGTGRNCGFADNSAQPGVSVNPVQTWPSHCQVNLAWSGPEQDDISGFEGKVSRSKSVALRIRQPAREVIQAQRIAGWHNNRPASCSHGRSQQSDAIKPAFRIATVQAERHADQLLCFISQLAGRHWAMPG